MIPPENGRLLAEHILGARLILFPDAGHLFFIERAADVNDAIRRFICGGL
jgi:pimeloyl-ACP methyl ester carboxylesterase